MNINKNIFANVFSVTMNMNDVFLFACAFSAEIPAKDFLDLTPFYEEYAEDLFVAYVSLQEDMIPENPNFQQESFFKAKDFILNKMNTEPGFCRNLNTKVKEMNEEKDLFNGQLVQYREYKVPWWFKQYLKLRRKSRYVVMEAYLESGEFARASNPYKAKKKLIEQYGAKK